jgi:dTMP kinase
MGRERYIVAEGVIRSGKTTQTVQFAEWFRKHYAETELVVTREPGGSEIADHIRSTVQGEIAQDFTEQMTIGCEVALYGASRGQTLETIVAPALLRGAVVWGDRSFITSGSYQGFGRGYGIERVMAVNRPIVGNVTPGLAIFFDLPLDIALGRARDVMGDKFERLGDDFFVKAREGYLWMIKNMPELNLVIVNAEGSREEVFERLLEVVVPKLKLWGVAMLGV